MLSSVHDTTYLSGDFKLKGEFSASNNGREEVLERCTKYAGWTLPAMFPDDPLNESDELQNDYQSVGAQAVNNLANKMMMALFQPTRPFFRMSLTTDQRESLAADGGLSSAEIDAAMAETEREAMRELVAINARTVLNDIMQHLIITGNSLLYLPTDGKAQGYSLRDYVINRDLRGEVVKMILRETKSVSNLPDELAAHAMAQGYHENDEVTIYTGIQRVNESRYRVWQELEDICYCHKKVGSYTVDNLPWIPLTWKLARGKDYGTGLVEEYSGDFHTLSTLAEAIIDYTVVVTDVKNLVDPAGMTDVREITEAPSGAYVHGREEDIFVHTANVTNAADFLEKQFTAVARRIGAAFLLTTAVTRDAERVTAEEIRRQAHELESSLGGVYSRLATELQQPLAKRLLRKIDLAFKDIEPMIVTGLESLSRNSDLDNFRAFMQDLVALSDVPDEVRIRLRVGDVIAVLGAGHGVDYSKFLKDEDTVANEKKQAIAAQAAAAGMEAKAVNSADGQGQVQ